MYTTLSANDIIIDILAVYVNKLYTQNTVQGLQNFYFEIANTHTHTHTHLTKLMIHTLVPPPPPPPPLSLLLSLPL